MYLSGLQTFLAGFSGLVGLILGVLVSSAALEELPAGKKYFLLLRDITFLFAAGIFFFQYGYVVLCIGLLLSTIVVHHLKNESGILLALFTIILLILSSNIPLITSISGLFLLIGMFEAGSWAASQQQIIKKGVFRKQVWQALYHEELFFFLLPLAGTIFLV